jgi:hypothetical protein
MSKLLQVRHAFGRRKVCTSGSPQYPFGSACLALAILSFIHAGSSSGPSMGSAIRSPRILTRSCQRA